MAALFSSKYRSMATEELKRILQKHNIKVAMKPVSTLRNYLMRPKDAILTNKQSGLIYSIPCKDCRTEYIGKTGRSLRTRKNEHKESVGLWL